MLFMGYAHTIVDFNGSLIPDPTEESLWRHVGVGLLKHHARYCHLRQTANLVAAGANLMNLGLRFRDGTIDPGTFEDRMYTLFNDHVLQGEPYHRISVLIGEYVKQRGDTVDSRVAYPLMNVRNDGKDVRVLSAGSREHILHTVQGTAYRGLFTDVHANRLETTDHTVDRFGYDVVNKPETLMDWRERGLPLRDIAYIGNDERDDDCFTIVDTEGGICIVAPLADDEYRHKAALAWGARTPQTHAEVDRALQR